ncbi:MAG: histone deacetylase, partial [Gemmatimonadales bacterium]
MALARTAMFFHASFLEHKTGRHVECPERVSVIRTCMAGRGLTAQVEEIPPEPASVDEIALIHSREYIQRVNAVAEAGGGWADPDTLISPGTWSAALHAVGAACESAEGVVAGRFEKTFALVRPPGHHAERSAARGFCVFNNIAVAAAKLLEDSAASRIAILDFDVHHGNGTQHAFYGDGRVLFVSFHRHPFYPGTGASEETGEGEGLGLTVNVPLASHTTPSEYLSLWREVLAERVAPFAPGIILVSAGFDLYRHDPVAGLNFEVEDFREIGAAIADTADAVCGGRVASVLEGGYDLDALGPCVEAYLEGLRAL